MPAKISSAIRQRAKRIQLFLCDVDGVLTDASIFIGGVMDCGGKRSATPLLDRTETSSTFANRLPLRKRCRGSRLATAVHDADGVLHLPTGFNSQDCWCSNP